MRKYEILYILDPQEEAYKRAIGDIKNRYEKIGAKLLNENNMGKRRLAYEIKKKTDGYYYVTQIEVEDIKNLEEFEKDLKHNQDVIRHMKIRL
ncbi:MAG: 30S ribosomal protein S6 [Spirochaetes bacterium]|nr:MAG: 30S ribosomal protein S6 [Spirochaetota bacterium]RKX98278.1 MAG: 30S ribosomal protein S6 [Spirochaetota bacterium]